MLHKSVEAALHKNPTKPVVEALQDLQSLWVILIILLHLHNPKLDFRIEVIQVALPSCSVCLHSKRACSRPRAPNRLEELHKGIFCNDEKLGVKDRPVFLIIIPNGGKGKVQWVPTSIRAINGFTQLGRAG